MSFFILFPHSVLLRRGVRERLGGVLVLAGVELIFFVVARMVLCLGFVLGTALVTQGWFSYC